jgi:hypothetical protein
MKNVLYNFPYSFELCVRDMVEQYWMEVFGTEIFDVYYLNYIHVVVDVIVSLCTFFATFTGIF